MQTIHKFAVPVGPVAEVDVPSPCYIVHVQTQHSPGVVCFWALVSDTAPRVRRRFVVQATGGKIEHNWSYVGTTMPDASIVWHLFEVIA